MNSAANPFLTAGYKGPSCFCDRKEETRRLTRQITEGRHTALFAFRRLGKTALIHHVYHPFSGSRKTVCLYLDILATRDLRELTNLLATEVYNRFPPKKSWRKKITEWLMQFRPAVTFDELSGSPSLTLTLDTKNTKENTIGQILTFLDRQGLRVVIAFDEFQQILEYPETNAEATLRTHMQQLKNISFIFCGSNQKMMREIFNSAKRPFFASCTNMNLGYIDKTEYKKFISRKFREYGRSIDDQCLEFICNWTCLHTFYTQHFCSVLFARNKKRNTLKDAYDTAKEILLTNEGTFYQYKNLLTDAQWKLLKAIAGEEKVFQPHGKTFIEKYGLGTPALVKRGLDALLNKEMIFYRSDTEKPWYEVYDKFLMRWMKSK